MGLIPICNNFLEITVDLAHYNIAFTSTGRVIAKGIGGGIKHKYHWIDWLRDGPKEGPPQEEKVVQVSLLRSKNRKQNSLYTIHF